MVWRIAAGLATAAQRPTFRMGSALIVDVPFYDDCPRAGHSLAMARVSDRARFPQLGKMLFFLRYVVVHLNAPLGMLNSPHAGHNGSGRGPRYVGSNHSPMGECVVFFKGTSCNTPSDDDFPHAGHNVSPRPGNGADQRR